jgi:hypothetical protein
MDLLMQLRVLIGDISEPYILDDDILQYYLDKNGGDVSLTAKEIMPIILVNLSTTSVREREGQVEIFGSERVKNYLDTLEHLNSAGSSLTKNYAPPTIGGVRKSEVERVRKDPESVSCGFKIGMFSE